MLKSIINVYAITGAFLNQISEIARMTLDFDKLSIIYAYGFVILPLVLVPIFRCTSCCTSFCSVNDDCCIPRNVDGHEFILVVQKRVQNR